MPPHDQSRPAVDRDLAVGPWQAIAAIDREPTRQNRRPSSSASVELRHFSRGADSTNTANASSARAASTAPIGPSVSGPSPPMTALGSSTTIRSSWPSDASSGEPSDRDRFEQDRPAGRLRRGRPTATADGRGYPPVQMRGMRASPQPRLSTPTNRAGVSQRQPPGPVGVSPRSASSLNSRGETGLGDADRTPVAESTGTRPLPGTRSRRCRRGRAPGGGSRS